MIETDVGMYLWFNGLLTFLAFGLHFMSKWQEHRMKVAPVAPWTYVKAIPAQAGIAVFSAALAFLVTWAEGWLNPVTALAVGYMPNSIVENIVSRSREMMQQPRR